MSDNELDDKTLAIIMTICNLMKGDHAVITVDLVDSKWKDAWKKIRE